MEDFLESNATAAAAAAGGEEDGGVNGTLTTSSDEFNVTSFIAFNLGPQVLDLSISAPMTAIYCVLWVCGMAGNLVLIIHISRLQPLVMMLY